MEKFGAARLRVVGEGPEVSPEHAVFEAMLDGWRTQRLSRNLAFGTVESGARVLRRFQDEVGRYPWQWSPADLENWAAALRTDEGRANSTIRSYGLTVSAFLDYVCDPAYSWDALCLQRFGTHAVQICGPANLAVHTIDQEARPSRRPLTRAECQALFDAADERTDAVRRRGAKGWAPAFRDATMLKVAYGWGLRRRELLMLERCDFGPNPKASEFGAFGVCHVRFGKAANGSPPRRRGVLTVMDWSVEVIAEWVDEVLTDWRADSSGLWPSERHGRVSEDRLNAAFAASAAAAGLPAGLSPHCLRHSYVSHLIEDGYDPLFVQQQVGHRHSSTTALYTSVSSDYRTRVLRAALDKMIGGTPTKKSITPTREVDEK
ncbi:MAG: site-specific integrase [Acidimicrobiales bacterium]|jgi:site-specific recombinase XerD